MVSNATITSTIHKDAQVAPRTNMHSNSHSPKYLMLCSCCPFGYHIDLDFVKYCESLAANATSNKSANGNEQSITNAQNCRRRQRHSMEVMLGVELNDFNTAWDQCNDSSREQQFVSKKRSQIHLTKLSPPPTTPPSTTKSSNNEFNFEDLDEAVNDFERTLKRSSVKNQRNYNNIQKNSNNTIKTLEEQFGDELDHLIRIGEKDVCISPNQHYSHNKYNNNDYNNYNDDEKLRKSFQYNDETVSQLESDLREKKSKLKTAPEAPPIPVRSLVPPSPPIRNRVSNEQQQALALSLNRIRSLEEQVKIIPVLQLQLSMIKEENHDLQKQLARSNDRRKLVRTAGCQTMEVHQETYSQHTPPLTTTNYFNLQRISPVLLQSFNKVTNEGLSPTGTDSSLIPPTPPPRNIRHYCDVGVATSPQVVTRDVGCSSSPRVRSVACHTDLSVLHLNDKLFTQQQVNDCIQRTIERFDRANVKIEQKQLKSVGTQVIKIQCSTQICQTDVPRTTSVGINVEPEKKNVFISAKPEMRTVGISVVQIEAPKPCEKCHVSKRSIGIGCMIEEKLEDSEKAKTSLPTISLKALDFAAVESVSQHKTVGTQCNSTKQESIGVQHQPQTMDKASQNLIIKNTVRGTDTIDLIRTFEQATNTKPPIEISTKEASCETNPIYLKESNVTAINIPGSKHKETSTNTDVVTRKEISCGTEERETPEDNSLSTENYCDSCKNLIKNFTQEFIGTAPESTSSPTTPQSPLVVSKIPRPSPHAQRKFVRQDTYTLPPECASNILPETLDIEQSIAITSGSTELFSERPAPTSTGIATKITTTSNTNDENICPAEIVLRRSLERQLQSQLSSENRDMLPSTSTAPRDNECILVPCTATRPKPSPSKEMLAALKVINDSLHKSSNVAYASHLKNANKIVQKEWFRVSSTEAAQANVVDSYLDHFEKFSNNLLRYMVNLIDSNGNTAMHYCISYCNFDIVSILLDSKVLNVNQTNNSGYTCIMLVSLAKLQAPEHHSVIRKLFNMSDVNIRARKHSQTALMLACSHGNIDMVSMLLENGADLNIQDEDGSTALMCSAEHGHFEIVKLLLSHPECDSTIQDIDGSTALKISLEAGFRDIGVLLYAHEHMTRNASLRRHTKKSRTTSQSSTS